METTRRSFVALAGGLVSILAPRAGRAAEPAATPTAPPLPTPTPTPSPAAAALAHAARERYGKFVTEEEAKLLDERVVAIERRGVRLRAFKLENSEEPAAEFRARR